MKEAVLHLQEMLSKPLVDLELVDPYYYHLDTFALPFRRASTPGRNQSTVFYTGRIDKIYGHFLKRYSTTSDQDNKVLACNMVVNGKNIVVGEGSPIHSERI